MQKQIPREGIPNESVRRLLAERVQRRYCSRHRRGRSRGRGTPVINLRVWRNAPREQKKTCVSSRQELEKKKRVQRYGGKVSLILCACWVKTVSETNTHTEKYVPAFLIFVNLVFLCSYFLRSSLSRFMLIA